MKIAVVGSSGSGKSTLAKALAVKLASPYVELDAVNWGSDWYDLCQTDHEEFMRRVDQATSGAAWVVDGGYGAAARELVWRRATHLIWLDYSRPVIMRRAIWRSFKRAVLRTKLWQGNVERWSGLLRRDHPIYMAWCTWRARRPLYETELKRHPHLTVFRLRQPRDVEQLTCIRPAAPDHQSLNRTAASSV
jgi:adenylate kinase family enzyme